MRQPTEAGHQSYFLISGNGYPSLLKQLTDSISDINDCPQYRWLIVCLDADEATVDERKQEVEDYLQQHGLTIKHAQLKIIIQNRCIETWLLGNPKIHVRQPKDSTCQTYARFFNVSKQDPEKMAIFTGFATHSGFHLAYLKAMFQERGISYSKNLPGPAQDAAYLQALCERVVKTKHLNTFAELEQFIRGFHISQEGL